jgi:serine/threonine protein kinase
MKRSTGALPLPIARLQRRANNARSPKDRHDAAWFAWEASLRLAAIAEGEGANEELRLAGLGAWRARLRRDGARLEDAGFAELHACLRAEDVPAHARRPTAAQLLDALVQYRNQVVGHGSQRSEAFYERGGRVLARLLEPAWEAGLFLLADARVLYVESVQLEPDGGVSGRVFDLQGEAPRLVEDVLPSKELVPERVYVVHGGEWRSLHPLAVFDEEHERLLMFNGQTRRARYLDFATGLALTGPELDARFPGLEAALNAHFRGTGSRGSAPARTPSATPRFGDCVPIVELGRGRSGTVWLAREEALGKLVAVKVLSQDLGRDVEALARFEREIDALARCDHPHVVRVHSRGSANGQPYFVMEYVEGASLAEVAPHFPATEDLTTAVERAAAARAAAHSAQRPTPTGPAEPTWTAELPPRGRWRQLARVLSEAARGLHHLHKRGIVHRDVCPANVLVAFPRLRAVVMDLGCALLDEQSVGVVSPAARARWLGALRYSAPEALERHLLEVDPRSDVYSLGAILYELSAGRALFDATDERALVRQILSIEPVPLSTIAPHVPPQLAAIAHRALQKDPAKRHEDARSLAKELEVFATSAEASGAALPRATEPASRGPRPWIWIAVGAVLIAAGIAVWLATKG